MSYNIINNKYFDSLDGSSKIEISIIDDITWFKIIKLDYENYKIFLYLLKDVIKYLNENNIKYIKQYVEKDSIQYFETSNYLEIEDDIFIVTTEISNFLNEIIKVLGINFL